MLFSPLALRGVESRNRIMVSPMCQYSATEGRANDWHLVHLGARAIGGAGIVCAEATAVTADGRISPWDLGLWEDGQVEPLRRIATFLAGQGALSCIQLAHAGRKASTGRPWERPGPIAPTGGGWIPVGPSPLPFAPGHPAPRELDEVGIAAIVRAFREAARRALEAGFEVVEVHAAHGYLLHQFLSPLSNVRRDAWGGSFENRSRLALQVVEAVRDVWPDSKPLFVRISTTDWVPGGWDLEESVALCRAFKGCGVDLVDCSSGGTAHDAKVPLGPGYQVPNAARIRKECGVAVAAVGLITQARQAEAILGEGKADLIALARQELRDPHFALHAARELGVDLPWPPQYLRGKE